MKKTLQLIGIVFLNLLLIIIGQFEVNRHVEIIARRTFDYYPIVQEYLIFPVLLICIVLLAVSPQFRKYGIGLTFLIYPCLIFSIYFLNEKFESTGEYKNFKLNSTEWIDDKYFINIEYRTYESQIEVPLEKCIGVDSVQVRIDKGLFGMKIQTNNVRISQNINCETSKTEDTISLAKQYFDLGQEYFLKRCTHLAINEYSQGIALDSSNPDLYYRRGLAYFTIENYEKAINDFYYASILRFSKLNYSEIKQLKSIEFNKYLTEIFTKSANNQIHADNAENYLNNISAMDDFDNYKTYINYCSKKLLGSSLSNK